MLMEPRCVTCGRVGDPLCATCVSELRPAPRTDPPPGVDTFVALVRYEAVARDLVVALKYRNTRPALGRLARAMAALVADRPVDLVTWAPTTGARRRARGYDQAELLARGVAASLHLPCRRLLVRSPGPAQTGRARAERLAGPRLTARRRQVGSILVVDDVCTTGATLAAAAAALRPAGGTSIHALTVAVTPDAP